MLDAPAARPGLVEAVVRQGVDWIQVRERTLDGAPLLALVDRVRAEAERGMADRPGHARVLVNRRVDVALASGADGAHLGFDAMTPGDARELLGEDAEIGISAHDPREIDPGSGASYAHLAPIHAPLSKPATRDALGPAALTAAARRGLPVIAQGGITADHAREAVAAGARGVAVTGTILQADDPARAARSLREALDA